MNSGLIILAGASVLFGAIAFAEEVPDLVIYSRIREEGAKRSRVMEYASALIDEIGPRLTGSPNIARSYEWAQKELTAMGCVNVRVESWGEFGMGWRQRNVWVRMKEPDSSMLIAQATPWSPSTAGPVTGSVVRFDFGDNFEAYRGKLNGKIVLFGSPPAAPLPNRPFSERLNEQQLAEFALDPKSEPAKKSDDLYVRVFKFFEQKEKIARFLAEEGVIAVIVPSSNNERSGATGGTIYNDTNYGFGFYVYRRERAMPLPVLVTTIESFGRLVRLANRKTRVAVEVNVDTEFTGDHEQGFNTFAEIRGEKDEVVVVGAHLDSWDAGTGATDDGAGVIVAMEAMRILKALQFRPKRTIRIALWSGEEQGSLGSRAYAKKYLADVPLATTSEQLIVPEFLRPLAGAIKLKPEHAKISAVYTLDAGGGRIRGVSLSHNTALVPLFTKWAEPLRDLGFSMIGVRSDCGGDCATFEQVGIPTPSFKQDPLEYDTRSHHTNMDVFERLQAEDLRQAAIVVATFLYQTAMLDENLPRNSTPLLQ